MPGAERKARVAGAPRKAAPAPAAALPGLDLSLQFGDFAGLARHRAILTRARVSRWMRQALQHPGEIAVRIVGEDEGRALNAQYRAKDYATNVLTFDYAQAPVVMADLVLCGPVVEREAHAQGKALADHYAHLLVHGTLHAQGWDHETSEADALAMETAEILLMGGLGLPNPY
ncbi:rRNA maturation RNase YbeY [Ramlibacter aquaticus]|uniref:Endoribonuclease YbeY n=1 Tax=Ramlibacter aquaticus TaxID=2780094 RepID=A0ABR9S9X4_9BURK|nr:rRNA maturation RNase YbeY [Ramlibacter aquaticus]